MTLFNDKHHKVRIKSEHCIGLLKNRFPSLSDLPNKIKSKKDMEAIIEHVESCAVLHNLLVKNSTYPEEWLNKTEEDMWLEIHADDELMNPTEMAGSRREQVMQYVLE